MNSGWKYGLIKIAIEDEGTDYEDQINMLVELYPLGEDGEYNAWCRADLRSLECIERAKKDVERDGILTHFYDTGTFEWKLAPAEGWHWDWTSNVKGE